MGAQKLSLAVSSRVRYWPNVVALLQICIQAYRYQWGLGLASEEGTDLLPHLLPQVDSNQMPKGTKTHCLCYLQCPGGRVPLAMVAPPPSLSAPTPSAPVAATTATTTRCKLGTRVNRAALVY